MNAVLSPGPKSGTSAAVSRRSFWAGLEYVAIVFAIGFGFGALRELWAAEALGRQNAELIELPIMIVASWLICRWIIHRRQLPSAVRLVMCATALLVLLVLEAFVAFALRHMSVREYVHHFVSVRGLLVWLGYLAFALAPLFVAR